MEKNYSFCFKDNKYTLEDKDNGLKEVFTIDAKKLQFDTLKYYEALFKDVNEKIEIKIEYAIEQECEIKENIEKSAKYIFDTLKTLTEEICDKLNTDCFSVLDDKN